jgi:hypothetical protein
MSKPDVRMRATCKKFKCNFFALRPFINRLLSIHPFTLKLLDGKYLWSSILLRMLLWALMNKYIDEHTTCIDDSENCTCPMFPVHLWLGLAISKREILCKPPHLKSDADILSISMWRTLTIRSFQSTFPLRVRVMKSINSTGMILNMCTCVSNKSVFPLNCQISDTIC